MSENIEVSSEKEISESKEVETPSEKEVLESKEVEAPSEKEIVDLTDTTQKLPVNKAVSEIMQLLSMSESLSKIIYFRLKQKYNQ